MNDRGRFEIYLFIVIVRRNDEAISWIGSNMFPQKKII
jgi:hypothetical protein